MKLFPLLPLCLLPCGLAFVSAPAWSQTSGRMSSPALSPDGKKLVFVRATPRGSRLFIGTWNGKTVLNARALAATVSGDDKNPVWRPDGEMIVFASSRGTAKRFDLYSISPSGTGLKRLTNTPKLDETEPQFSPHRFTLREGSGEPFVPDRSRATLTTSELKLIQRLAGNDKAIEKYTDDSYRPTFGAKVGARFYKLVARQGTNNSDGKLFVMRDDGSDRRLLDAGMAGSYDSPRIDPAGKGLVFRRVATGASGGTFFYYSAFPIVSEVLDDKGVSKGMQVATKDWRASFKRLNGDAGATQVAFSPNGETLAMAGAGSLTLLSRPDTALSTLAPVRKTTSISAPSGLFWARDGKTAFVSSAASDAAAVSNADSLADVHNLLDFSESANTGGGLIGIDRPLLSRNSFVVGGEGSKQMFSVYEETDYSDLPVFVSSDSLLHLNHLVFDSLLRETETKNLLPTTIELTSNYLRASIQQSRGASALRNDAIANAAYWAVVARLLRGEIATGLSDPPASASEEEAAKVKENRSKNIAAMNALTQPLVPLLAALPPEAKALANAEIALIKKHEDRAKSPIFGGALTGVGQPTEPLIDTRIDYTQFVPRGHYTRTEALRRYFLAQRWLSEAPFRSTPAHLRRALLMASATDAVAQKKLQTLTRVMAQFVGEADDRRFLDFVSIARGLYGATVPIASLGDADKMALFAGEVNKLPKPRIAPSGGPAMTLYPAPYTLDSEAAQNLVYDRKAPDVGTEAVPRYFALGLDMMGVLGSDRARNLLDTFTFGGSFFDFGVKESGYANYANQFKVERAKMDALPESEWKKSFYAQTLWSLRPLLSSQSNPRYKFTQNTAWTDKQLQAALGAWAELKHDTMPKQPVAIEAGGEGGMTEVMLEEQPQGFVEPSPELFKRLRELVSNERVALAGAGYLSKESDERLGAFGALLDMVTRLEGKQRAGQAFTKGEVEQLRFFGTFLEHITLISTEGQAQTMEDNDMAIIADVSSALSTRADALRVLEEGVGHALPIYVAFERDGRRQMARGAAYSYYEFTHPASERLSDAAWQELLSKPEAPAMPAWTKSFVSRTKGSS
ncbi:DUF3160 domain-containing protein [bacterium]|nr:MAG: DUF3160 domain-containing protein [bacterium]